MANGLQATGAQGQEEQDIWEDDGVDRRIKKDTCMGSTREHTRSNKHLSEEDSQEK